MSSKHYLSKREIGQVWKILEALKWIGSKKKTLRLKNIEDTGTIESF